MLFELSLDGLMNRSHSPVCLEPRRSKSVCSPRLTISSTNSLNEQDQDRIRSPSPYGSRQSLYEPSEHELKKNSASAPDLEKRPITPTFSVSKPKEESKNSLAPHKTPLGARKSLGVEYEFKLFSADSLTPVTNQLRKLSLR
ncbi:unnamed protein product, partial [Mesorhabditis spiculigera]